MNRIRLLACTLAALCACAAALAQTEADPGRVFGSPSLLGEDDTLGHLSVAIARSDRAALESLLEDPHLPGYLRAWHRGRLHYRDGDFAAAGEAFETARQELRRLAAPEQPDFATDMLDHARALAALLRDDGEALRRILNDAVGLHHGDAVWRGLLAFADEDRSTRRAELDAAWKRASGAERRHPVFARRALLHAGEGESEVATAWLDYAENLKSSEQRRQALAIWDGEAALREAVEAGGDRPRLVRWLARVARRDQGLDVALRGAEGEDDEEAARCFALVAEQYYRLRRHAELRAWLERERPAELDDEENADLDAYPWGMLRREQPASPEIARGFDTVVSNYPGTRRAMEALWEAAWMWELSDEIEEAEIRYLRYATEAASGPFAQGAAARTIFLAARRGDAALANERLDQFRELLGDSHDRAGALWAAWRASLRAGDDELAAERREQLEQEHGTGPFVSAPAVPMPREFRLPPMESTVEELFDYQLHAFEELGELLGAAAANPRVNEPLGVVAWLYRHGFLEEGDRRLSSFAQAHRRNSRTQLDCVRLAWAMGRAEQQARIAWTLWLRENGRSAEADRALEAVAFPTPFAPDVLRAAEEERLPAGLLFSVMRRESFFDPAVLSHAGAYGLLQLMPGTASKLARELGESEPEPERLWDPLLNLRYGARYLSNLLEESGGDIYYALAAYNAGEGMGARWVSRRLEGEGPETVLLLISYNETRAYVYHLLRYWGIYGQFHAALGQPGVSAGR